MPPASDSAPDVPAPAPGRTGGTARLHLLDWRRPALPQAAAALLGPGFDAAGPSSTNGPTLDAPTFDEPAADRSGLTVILPGRRAGRILLESMLEEAERAGRVLVPPAIGTPGDLPRLHDELGLGPWPETALAPTELERVVWAAALRASDDPRLDDDGGGDRAAPWSTTLRQADRLRRACSALRQWGRTELDAAEGCEALDQPVDAERWRAIDALAEEVDRRLGAEGLLGERGWLAARGPGAASADPRPATANEASTAGPSRLVLVGVTELTWLQRRVLGVLGRPIDAFVHADAARLGRFDELGCIRPEAWPDRSIEIPPESIEVCPTATDQADRIWLAVDGWARRPEGLRSSDLTIGLPDDTLEPALRRTAAWAGIDVHVADGVPAASTRPLLALACLADWLDQRRAVDLARALRHPLIARWLREIDPAAPDLAAVDAERAERLLDRLEGLDGPFAEGPVGRAAAALDRGVAGVLADGPAPLGAWIEPVLGLVGSILGATPTAGAEDEAAAVLLRDRAAPLQRAPASLQPVVGPAEAIHVLLETIADARLPEDVRRDQVELLGWLELHLDPAEHLVVADVREGAVPGTVGADPLLPAPLRRWLGLPDRRHRLARDGYLLQAIVRSRRCVRLLAPQRSADGEPLTPSRLLLTGGPAEGLADRVDRLVRPGPLGATWPVGLLPDAPRDGEIRAETAWPPPPLPRPVTVPEPLPVTAFGRYLRCPYRFALAVGLRLEHVEPDARSLDGAAFGSLAHEALTVLGTPALRDETDRERLTDALLGALRRAARSRLGPAPPPIARVQLARIAQRLRGVAALQAGVRRTGWHVHSAEFTVTAPLELGLAEPVLVRGRIDRLDHHPGTGAWRVLDYKTGDAPLDPIRAHHGTLQDRAAGRWIDLQLPIYDLLLRAAAGDVAAEVEGADLDGLAPDRGLELGYCTLPRRSMGASIDLADWSTGELDDARATAGAVAAAIRGQSFDGPVDPGRGFDPYPWICRSGIRAASLGAPAAGDDDEAEG